MVSIFKALCGNNVGKQGAFEKCVILMHSLTAGNVYIDLQVGLQT